MVKSFQVGVIAGTHGIRGDIKVFPTTDDPKRFLKLKKVKVTVRGKEEVHTVSGIKFQDKFVILHLSGIDTPEDARLYRTLPIMIDREDAVKLPEGRYYIPDLLGSRVVDEEEKLLGTLTDVLQTGANDVYEITPEGGTPFLIPAIHDCILEVKPEEQYIRVHLLPGLRE